LLRRATLPPRSTLAKPGDDLSGVVAPLAPTFEQHFAALLVDGELATANGAAALSRLDLTAQAVDYLERIRYLFHV
jgi:hypothetical protein